MSLTSIETTREMLSQPAEDTMAYVRQYACCNITR
jgi:hypothetical protein